MVAETCGCFWRRGWGSTKQQLLTHLPTLDLRFFFFFCHFIKLFNPIKHVVYFTSRWLLLSSSSPSQASSTVGSGHWGPAGDVLPADPGVSSPALTSPSSHTLSHQQPSRRRSCSLQPQPGHMCSGKAHFPGEKSALPGLPKPSLSGWQSSGRALAVHSNPAAPGAGSSLAWRSLALINTHACIQGISSRLWQRGAGLGQRHRRVPALPAALAIALSPALLPGSCGQG